MQIQTNQSPAQVWFAHQGLTPPVANSPKDILHLMRLSQYAVERAFDNLSKAQRGILTAVADIDTADYQSTDLSGDKLRHYTAKGRYKIAIALRDLRTLCRAFPAGIRTADFNKLDHHSEG